MSSDSKVLNWVWSIVTAGFLTGVLVGVAARCEWMWLEPWFRSLVV